jgi:RNA polymerase sigma factor (sigma-70 family)
MWSSEAWSSAADLYLLARSREGSAEAFGELWRRHLPAAYAVATKYQSRTAAEDIVAEASARVFSLIQEGKGPDEHFRAYFLSAVKTVAIDHGRRELKVVPTEDDALERLSEPVFDDLEALDEGFDADLIRTAFRGLSERDQRVLWHTTVEGEAPRTLAPVLGMSANAVSARAMRAREALRAQYLDACAQRSLPNADGDECRWVISQLSAHVRGRLPKRQNARVEEHLKSCPHASMVAADLRAIHHEFPALIVPFIFLAGLSTPGFVSAAATAGLASGAGAAGAWGAAGGAGGAGAAGPAGSAAGAGAAAGSAAGAGAAAGAATSSSPPGSAVGDVVGQVAGRATTLVASIAIGVGLASVVPLPAEPVVAAQPPPANSAAPTSVATPTSTPPPPTTATQTPTQQPPLPTQNPPTTVRPTPAPTSVPTLPPVAPSTPPQPSSEPTSSPPVQRVSPATATVHVVQRREATRFLLKVRGVEGRLTVVVSTPAGGELTVHNSSWACTSLAPSSLRCTGEQGQAMLLQSGLEAPSPIRVVITDSTGATRTQTLSLA